MSKKFLAQKFVYDMTLYRYFKPTKPSSGSQEQKAGNTYLLRKVANNHAWFHYFNGIRIVYISLCMWAVKDFMVSVSPGTFIDMKASYAKSKLKFFIRNTRATGIHRCIINLNSVTKMTQAHKNFNPKISIYMKSRLFMKIFSIKN